MKKTTKYFKVYIMLFALLLGMKIIAYSISPNVVRENVRESYNMMAEEGIYPQIGYKTEDIRIKQQIDSYSDAIFLNIAYEIGEHGILKEVAADYCGGEGNDPLEQLGYRIDHLGENAVNYGRQWFGAMAYIRSMLALFNLAEIRYILQIVFWLLLAVSFHLLGKKVDYKIAYAFLIGMLSVASFAVPYSLNVLNAFLVIVIMVIFICIRYQPDCDIGLYIFVTGAVTAYLDLFLTPFITFGTITILLLYLEYKNRRLLNICEGIKSLIKCACLWLIGYLGFWASKWLYASIVLGENMFKNAWLEMKNVSAGRVDWGPDTAIGYVTESLHLNLSKLFPYNIYQIVKEHYSVPAGFVFLLLSGCFFLFWWRNKKEWKEMYFGVLMLGVAALPYMYYVVMHVHTFVHCWVEYRYQAIAVMGGALAYLTTISAVHDSKIE